MSATPQAIGSPVSPATSVTTSRPRTIAAPSGPPSFSLQFTGTSAEYFRIWIVNVCLTLLTLGIFSAWAKVRKKRYFYSHTVLDGTPFQYLGQPIPILKGRIVAVALFGLWYVGTHYVIQLLPVVAIIALVLAPWVLVRSAAFNARYSAYRNMTFEFRGSYWSAFKMLYGWGAITLLTLGIAFSWWQQRIKQYMVTHSGYGDTTGELNATGGQFFRVYALGGLMFGGALGLAGAIAGFMFAKEGRGVDQSVFFGTFTVMVYLVYVAMFAYMRARIANLVWNHTLLGPLKFESRLTARSLLALYVTNLLAIAVSLGLLIPWAVVRTHKYRAERFSVIPEGDLREFRGSSESSVEAAGAEVGELFDFDMSI
jgi:uncharacterized membrane protein YjgN (DUF898 family)